jgi:hypothetical protein
MFAFSDRKQRLRSIQNKRQIEATELEYRPTENQVPRRTKGSSGPEPRRTGSSVLSPGFLAAWFGPLIPARSRRWS